MSQTRKISRNNTTVAGEIPGTNTPRSCTLHNTVIVEYWPSLRRVRFCTGGWATSTTRTRMMQCCNEWGLPFGVSFAKGKEGVYRHGEDTPTPFVNGEVTLTF